MAEPRIVTGRAFERLISFSDGVSAVAITLLALPLVSIGRPQGNDTVWVLIGQNFGTIIGFAIAFVVVAIMWRVHTRVFQSLRGYDGFILALNTAWLALLVVLPWATSMFGSAGNSLYQGGEGLAGTGLFYWGLMSALSAISATIVWHAARVPGLLEEGEAPSPVRGLVFAAAFLMIGVATLFWPLVAAFLPLGFIVVGPLADRLTRRPA
jgi:uncharacterized membrane protein